MSWSVRWIVPVIILLVGAGVSWWSARATNAVEQHVRHEVIELIPLVRDNPSIIERMVVDPVLYIPVGKSLVAVTTAWSGNKKDLTVTVTTGDDPTYGDGSATHVALVGVAGTPVLGLRILCDGAHEPMLIAGVWTP